MTRRNSTIDDVAKEAGVARVTVSRVLNNVQNVRPETRERVRRAVETLGYSVNHQARALASGSGTQIMLIHAHNPEREPNSFYNAGLELARFARVRPWDLTLVTRAIDPQGEHPSRVLASILEHERPAGIVVSAVVGRSRPCRLRTAGRDQNGRHLGRRPGPFDLFRQSASTTAPPAEGSQHLVELGHRRLGFIKGPPDHQSAGLRYDGFLDALRDGGISDEPWTATGDFTFHSGVVAAERQLREQGSVTCLACANDDMAAGAMLALHRAGLEIPSAMSVTGFDDTPMSQVMWPPLTTVRQPIRFLAKRAVHLLFEIDPTPQHEWVEHELVVRESTSAQIGFEPLDTRLGLKHEMEALP